MWQPCPSCIIVFTEVFDSDSKKGIEKYIVVAQLKQVFGASIIQPYRAFEKLKDIPGKPFSLSVLQGIHFLW